MVDVIQVASFANDVEVWRDPVRGRNLSQRIWGNRHEQHQAINTILRESLRNGETVQQASDALVRYVRPSYARFGDGKARYAANRLASNEMRRANALSTQAVAMTDPAGGFLRYRTSGGHIVPDECSGYASHDEGFGRGVYPARSCPLPPIHVNCSCNVSQVGPDTRGMDAFVDQLRVEYGLNDPPDLSPADLAIFRRETAQVRQDVQVMFRAWFAQTGLVTREQLIDTSPTVKSWIARVSRAKRRN